MAKYFRTIHDMANFWYNPANLAEINAEMQKTDAPIKTSTTGVRNVLFGAKLYIQLVNSMNTFGLLEKKPWEKSGYRAVTYAATATGSGLAGTDESGAISPTIKPVFAEITIPPKLLHIAYEESSLQMALEGKDDTTRWADISKEMQAQFIHRVNVALNTDNNTLAATTVESLDRVIASYAEITASGVTAGDGDIYSIDRDAGATWVDSYVSHGSQTDRTLTLDLVDTVLTNIRPYWDSSKGIADKIVITGLDTLERMQQLLVAQQRFSAPVQAKVGVNGIQTLMGAEAGFNIATYQGIPVFPENDMQQDVISRIYIVDKDHLHFGMLTPPQHLETRGPQDYILLDAFNLRAVDYLQGEVVCTKFKAQGKVRDLK